MATKNRKYFKSNDDGVATSYYGYILKWIDLEDMSIKSEGPFSDQKEATTKLSDYLRSGVCSWLVTYHG